MSKFLQKNRDHRLISSINAESLYLNVIQRLLDIGLDGVDVSKSRNAIDKKIIDMVCGKYVTTVGSDFHGFHSHMLGKRVVHHDQRSGQDFFEELDDSRANIIDHLKVIEKYRSKGQLAPVQIDAKKRVQSQETKMFSIQDGKIVQNKLDNKSYHVIIHEPAPEEHTSERHEPERSM